VPEAELARIKREVDLVELVGRSGVELKRRGQDLAGLCPFHDDTEPSLVVTPSKNLWHCLGACQAGGSVIDWVMRFEGISFRKAVELLRRDYSPSVEALTEKRRKHSQALKFEQIATPEVGDAELLGRVIDFYHRTLLESPEALAYLEERGLSSREAIERFRLGYSNRTLGYRIPQRQWKEGRELRGRLQELGVLRKSGHEHLRGCLVVPIFDRGGRVVEVYGRRITSGNPGKVATHLYMPGPHRGVFNVDALTASKEVILCEALLDALTFWCHGFHNVTSAYGVEGFTREHLEAFKAHGTERVLIAYDRDAAGEKAAAKLAETLLAEGIECFRLQFPRGMDANAYALKVTPAEKSLALLIHNAAWLGKGTAATAVATAVETSEAAAETAGDRAAEEAAEEEEPQEEEPPAPSLAAGGEGPSTEDTASPAASPVPPSPAVDVPAEVSEQEVVILLGDRRYRVRGLGKNLSYDTLKVNLLAARGEGFHVDTLDLYAARQRAGFVKQAAAELGIKEAWIKKDLGKVLLKLEELQDLAIREALAPKETKVELSEAERNEALELLRSEDLAGRILEDFARCGVVGEETNKLVGYMVAVSRKLAEPLAAIIQSSSAAGKTSLMEAVLALVPEEERVQYSAMTGQSLFYMGEEDLKHKVLAIVEEEGAERASYALKLLQSEGELSIASTGKDPASGRLVTHEYRVEGPVAILLTTTAIDLDEELQNRAIVLSVDEERGQTRAIHRLQRERRTLDGLLAREERSEVVRVHRNAQRLLEPLSVVNPYGPELTFLDTRTRTRRDHEKYLTLIDTIALLHQRQREVKVVERPVGRERREIRYVEVELSDVELANRLAHEVLGRSLDELPPQTRGFLTRLDELVEHWAGEQGIARADVRFRARAVREALALGATQVKLHLRRLVDLEYVVVHTTGHGVGWAYELVYRGEGEDGRPFLPGLIDVEKLWKKLGYDGERSGSGAGRSASEADRSAPGRPPVGPRSGSGRGGSGGGKRKSRKGLSAVAGEEAENADPGQATKPAGRSVAQGGQ
jgi:DNA primase catalytic core